MMIKKGLIIIVTLVVLLVILHNIILNLEEERVIGKYSYYKIGNDNMHVYDSEIGEDTIVLLSGYGTGSPIIDYLPLTNRLKDKFRIVVIEYFGYGYSDDTKRQRIVENIVEEIHYVLNELEIKRYTLLAHSISGIYAQYYIGKYRNEIEAYIGLENAIPEYLIEKEIPGITFIDSITRRSGIIRLINIIAPNQLTEIEMQEEYNNKELVELRKALIRNYKNMAQLDEIDNYSNNVKKASKVIIDNELPILFIVSRNNHDNPERWIKEHEKVIEKQDYGAIIEYDGSHYLHHERSEEISRDIKEFMEK